MAPVKVDEEARSTAMETYSQTALMPEAVEACAASMASGSLGARLKVAGKEFVIENQERSSFGRVLLALLKLEGFRCSDGRLVPIRLASARSKMTSSFRKW